MQQPLQMFERRTSADIVFDHLYEQIATLDLLPGDKLSEAEVASRFGVSRQPVRDAFSRLGNLNLLLIRPQKATEVRKFSRRDIETARFVRLSIEAEVLRRAGQEWDGSCKAELDANLDQQRKACEAGDVDRFHALDYEFHQLLCRAGKAEFAFEIISRHKAQVDRLCVLSLTEKDSMKELIEDHATLIAQLEAGDAAGVDKTIRLHLSRLDATIEHIHNTHRQYFEA